MNNNEEFDANIIAALSKLKKPLKNSKNISIIFSVNDNNDKVFRHIANKKHLLKVRDIEIVPNILLNGESEYKDKKSNKFKTDYGKRLGKNNGKKYLKIVTRKQKKWYRIDNNNLHG